MIQMQQKNGIFNINKPHHIMRTQVQKLITLNQNMLRYAQMEIDKQAYLDAMCVIAQIQKSLDQLPASYVQDFRIYMLKAKAKRKKQEILKKAARATPVQINYGSAPIEKHEQS